MSYAAERDNLFMTTDPSGSSAWIFQLRYAEHSAALPER